MGVMARLSQVVSVLGVICALPWLGSCSLGKGTGEVHSDRLKMTTCWDGTYDLGPDFFAGVPYHESFQIRIQRGSDLEEVSDGVSILVDDVSVIRASLLSVPLDVGLAPGVTPPGRPVVATASPPMVHLALYLHNSCHEENSALYAVRGVIMFEKLFNGDPNETSADQRLTTAVFDVMVGDPRDEPAQGGDIPEDKLSRVTGWFRFYFQRGQPGQPFP
jgi:hypothetical protein